MKHRFAGIIALLFLFKGSPAQAQSIEVQQLLLDWQKLLQERQILADMKDGYQVLSKGYHAIRDICKGSFDLHKTWLDELLAVNSSVRSYGRVADIVVLGERITGLYTQAWAAFRNSPRLRSSELTVIDQQYNALLTESARIITTLTHVLTDGEWRASDAERLSAIDRMYEEIRMQYIALAGYTNRTSALISARDKDQAEIDGLQKFFQ